MKNIPKSIIRNSIIFALSISVLLLTQIKFSAQALTEIAPQNKYVNVLYGGDFDIDCENASAESFETGEETEMNADEADRVIKKYHEMINCLFNKNIKIMVKEFLPEENNKKSLSKADLDRIFSLLAPPAIQVDENGLPKGRKDCKGEGGQQNISTYCLAQAATNEYFEFREAMIKAHELERQKAGTRFETLTGKKPQEGQMPDVMVEQRTLFGAVGDVLQGQKSLQGYGARINRIDREIDIARQTLDQALAAYNEMQMALPLHAKFQETIKLLEKYRDKISKVRKEIDFYPRTFIDVTTPSCK